MKSLYYIKGHCGWDVLSLLLAEQIPEAEQLETVLKILDPPIDGGIEVGLLSATETPNDIRVRIVDSSIRNWIAMCGGMTQVIGKALIETSLRDYFRIDVGAPVVTARILTDSCVIPLRIDVIDERAARVTTCMDSYATLTYSLGLRDVVLEGVPALVVGEYLLVQLRALEAMHSGVDFTRRDPGLSLDIVNEMLRAHHATHSKSFGTCAILYDDRPEGPGHFRVFPRFLDPTAARIPYEFQCGTGTIALAVGLAHTRALPFTEHGTFILEWGSQRSTPDPYGIRTSHVNVELEGNRIVSASFSHSVVEISLEGHVRI